MEPASKRQKVDEGIQSWLVPAVVPKLFKPKIEIADAFQWGECPETTVNIQSMQYDDEHQSFTV